MRNLLRVSRLRRIGLLHGRCVLLFVLLSCPTLDFHAAAQPQTQSPQTNSPGQEPSGEMAVKDEAATTKMAEAAKFRVNVRLVLARVVVRDSDGNAVGNLHKEDFELFDNGKSQVISNFDVEHLSSSQFQPTSVPGTTEVQPGSPKPAEKPALDPAFPARYVAYLFDDLHLSFENVSRVRNAAEHRIDRMNPGERIGIFSTSGLTVADFTDDRAKLHEALKRLGPRPSRGGEINKCPDINLYLADLIINKNDPEAQQTAVNEYVNCSAGMTTAAPANVALNGSSLVRGLAMQVLQVEGQDSRTAIAVLKDAVRRISAMPGQRTLVLVSPGFVTPELQYDYNEAIDRALRAQVIINSLDARGLYVIIPFGDASEPGKPDVDVAGQPFTPSSHAALDMQKASAESEIMATLANATGGIFFHNNNDMDEGFRRVGEAPETYYLLGFTPANLKPDGKYHSLKVALKVHGKYDLQARRGYYAPNHAMSDAEEDKREIEDEVLSMEELHDLPVALHTQFFKASDDSAKLTVLARVDVKRLRYKQADDRNQNDLTVVTAVFDRNGNFLQANQKVVQMRWRSETLQNKLASGITLTAHFDVKPGHYLVRVVARDTEQKLMSAENGTVEIP